MGIFLFWRIVIFPCKFFLIFSLAEFSQQTKIIYMEMVRKFNFVLFQWMPIFCQNIYPLRWSYGVYLVFCRICPSDSTNTKSFSKLALDEEEEGSWQQTNNNRFKGFIPLILQLYQLLQNEYLYPTHPIKYLKWGLLSHANSRWSQSLRWVWSPLVWLPERFIDIEGGTQIMPFGPWGSTK